MAAGREQILQGGEQNPNNFGYVTIWSFDLKLLLSEIRSYLGFKIWSS